MTRRPREYIHCCGYRLLSRFVELRAAPSAAAEEAARLLLDIFGRYGPARFLRTDNGSQFTAGVISNFLALVGTERQLTVAYRPASNGMVERANAEVMRHLRAIVMERRVLERWSESLPAVQQCECFSATLSLLIEF